MVQFYVLLLEVGAIFANGQDSESYLGYAIVAAINPDHAKKQVPNHMGISYVGLNGSITSFGNRRRVQL